jgi:hypothetical protein
MTLSPSTPAVQSEAFPRQKKALTESDNRAAVLDDQLEQVAREQMKLLSET